MESIDGIARLRPDLIGQPQGTDSRSVDEHVEDDGTFGAPGLRRLRLGGIVRLEQSGTTDLDRLARDDSLDPHRR